MDGCGEKAYVCACVSADPVPLGTAWLLLRLLLDCVCMREREGGRETERVSLCEEEEDKSKGEEAS